MEPFQLSMARGQYQMCQNNVHRNIIDQVCEKRRKDKTPVPVNSVGVGCPLPVHLLVLLANGIHFRTPGTFQYRSVLSFVFFINTVP